MSRWLLLLLAASSASAYDSGRAGFSVRVDDTVIPYHTFAVFVLPNEEFDIEVMGAGKLAVLVASAGKTAAVSGRKWLATAPSRPGVYAITLRRGKDRMQLNVVVMHPASEVVNGHLNGFRIGAYPTRALNGDPIYLPPDGFIELNEKTAPLPLSPHFELSQFPSKQPGGYPKYLVLQERLLLKLSCCWNR